MNTIAYLLIIIALFLIKGMTKGRSIAELPGDLKDTFNAVITGDAAALKEAVNRSGTNQTPAVSEQLAATPGSAGQSAFSGAPSADAEKVIAFARAQIGKPYKWGSTGPDSFDCSGLTYAAYKSIGKTIPRTTAALQLLMGQKVARADLIPGDLVFPDAGHVQIYSGNGKIIESAKPGTTIREVAMWGFLTARRVLPAATAPNAAAGSGTAGSGGGSW